MAVPTLIELAESGAHFGHHRSMVYPKAQRYIYGIQSNVALIDLEQTRAAIEQAQKIIKEYRQAGKTVLFVGTKRSVRDTVKMIAESLDSPYIIERWFGGTLTNFSTMESNIKKMNDLVEFLAGDEARKMVKKERLMLENKLHRYQRFLGGLANLKSLPDLIVLASANGDGIAIAEANQLGIPVLAIADTNINPANITYPIPANDDAPRAVELILRAIADQPAAKTEPAIVAKAAPTAAEPAEVETPAEPKAKAVQKTVTKKPAVKKAAAKPAAKSVKK